MSGELYGKYRAEVVDTHDPEGQARVMVRWRTAAGEHAGWAAACFPPGRLVLPEVGDLVWIEFEAGEPSLPVWTGCAWPSTGEPRPTE